MTRGSMFVKCEYMSYKCKVVCIFNYSECIVAVLLLYNLYFLRIVL